MLWSTACWRARVMVDLMSEPWVWKNTAVLSVSGSCHRGDSPALGERNLCEHEHQVTCGTGEETL